MSDPIRVSSFFAPLADEDNYAVTDEEFHRGGYQTLADLAARDRIPPARLKIGQHVRTAADGKFWRLQSEAPVQWIEVDLEAIQAKAAADQAALLAQDAEASAANAQVIAENAIAEAGAATQEAEDASVAAAEAKDLAEQALQSAAGWPIDEFLGTITTLGQDPGTAATLSGKWWQIGITGTLSHANAGGLVVTIGDRLLSDGTPAWKLYKQSPAFIPDASIDAPKLTANTQARYGALDNFEGWQRVVVTPAGVLGYGVKNDGTFVAKLPITVAVSNGLVLTRNPDFTYSLNLGATQGILPIGAASEIREDPALFPGTLWSVHTPAGKYGIKLTSDGTVVIPKAQILSGLPAPGESQELIDARGSRPSLDLRLSESLDDYGLPATSILYRDRMRETRQRLMTIEHAQPARFVWACVGDSWTQAGFRYVTPSVKKLMARYGSAGPGWVGFGMASGTPNNSADEAHATVTARTGLFGTNATANYINQTSPDCAGVVSDQAGDQVTVSYHALHGNASVATIHYRQTPGGGIFQFRFNGGAWTPQSTSGTEGPARLQITGEPVGDWTMDIAVVSGAVSLYGLDIRTGSQGVIVHKLGNSGARASRFLAIDANSWQLELSALNPNLVSICLGTNDQAGQIGAAAWRADLGALMGRVRAAVPAADLLVVMPCENGLGLSPVMRDYTLVSRELAATGDAAFLDLQSSFGRQFTDYGPGSNRPWFASDNVHPNAAGGYAITAAVNQLFDFD